MGLRPFQRYWTSRGGSQSPPLRIPAELPEQRFGPLVAEGLRNPLSQAVGIIARAAERGGDASAAVRVEDGGIEGQRMELIFFPLDIDIAGPGGHRDQAAPFELGQGAPFGKHGPMGGRIVERTQEITR